MIFMDRRYETVNDMTHNVNHDNKTRTDTVNELAGTEGVDLNALSKATEYVPPPSYDTQTNINPDYAIYTDYQAPAGTLDLEQIKNNNFTLTPEMMEQIRTTNPVENQSPDSQQTNNDWHDEARYLEGERRRRLQEIKDAEETRQIAEREQSSMVSPADDTVQSESNDST